MRARNVLLVLAVASLAVATVAGADAPGTVVHEQIPPDPKEDLTFNATVDGDMPVAIETRSGPVDAPDARRPVSPGDTPSAGSDENENTTFRPDRNTKRPNVQGYDEPFTPSTAPFKRLEAFDAVNDRYDLAVADKRMLAMPLTSAPATDADDLFFADLVIDVAPTRKTRIPTVGPGTRILHAHLSQGSQEVPFHILHDGADNWFVEPYGVTARARLVMELAISRGVFGGEFADKGWNELGRAATLPANVVQSAREVQVALGLDKSALRPREAVTKLVTYFRSFVDSDEPPRGHRDIYLDLALSKKGVCRHRAFAFMITAQSLGIPTRMVLNEAHAWVEVNDGVSWRRIDLGGAGQMVNPASNAMPERQVHEAPPDNFQWPQGSERGEDMVEQARRRAREELEKQSSQQPGEDGRPSPKGPENKDNPPTPSPSASAPAGHEVADAGAISTDPNTNDESSESENGKGPGPGDKNDERPSSVVTVIVKDPDAHRGAPLALRGEVTADGEPCAHVSVELYLKVPKSQKRLFLGAVATEEDGKYSTSSIVVPGTVALGDYGVMALTAGDTRCGRGGSL